MERETGFAVTLRAVICRRRNRGAAAGRAGTAGAGKAGRAILHMQKTMTVMNVQLSNAISDISGATGQAIIRAILNGEEAELGVAFLCADFGIANEPRPDHAAYLAHWLSILRQDKLALFTAASKAQAAADWLHARPSVSSPEWVGA